MIRDQAVFRKRLRKMHKSQADQKREKLAKDVDYSARLRLQRQAAVPQPHYPLSLPVLDKKQLLLDCIEKHQVSIIAGETGSGKSTQIPKLCLELGRGIAAMIGHTQPRRLAARNISQRLAQELSCTHNKAVGYKVRFTDETDDATHIKIMTDGILLAEIQQDRQLTAYDTIIIDEAHERTVNIDFLLGYLKSLLPKRPDLKLIITSATIDTERFARFFDNAPVIEVSGRTFPVDIRYREPRDFDEEDPDFGMAVAASVEELSALHREGDVLVFLSGEGEIKEIQQLLSKRLQHWEILPLYARLSMQDQQRIFHPACARRVILTTNVAETSLTVPGIRYVVDAGMARISRYSSRSKVQRLPIEKIAQANANQRAGRCGRTGPGVCIRLYSEEDFLNRPAFMPAEITRSNLAGVILHMKQMGLGDIEDFDFIEAPDNQQIKAGYNQLMELQALDANGELTETGDTLSRMPVDPQVARMFIGAAQLHCLAEVLIIGTGLAVADLRERPLQHRQAADSKHKHFQAKNSDFISLLNLWRHLQDKQNQLANRAFKQYCHEQYLSHRRWREWRDLHRQMQRVVKDARLRIGSAGARQEEIHRALLSGLLGNVANKSDKHHYTGARGMAVYIFPGSGLFKAAPPWLMAAEYIETSKLYAHTVARIEPEWVERAAAHLVKKTYFQPHWRKKGARVMAYEQVTLYGLILVAKRPVNYGPIDPVLCRRLFIQHALVQHEYHTRAPYAEHNRRCVAEVEGLEDKSRRREYLVDDTVLFDFFDRLIPAAVVSGDHFEAWRKKAESRQPELLFLRPAVLLKKAAEDEVLLRFPDSFPMRDGGVLGLSYYFEPGHPRDGVTVTIPVNLLHRLSPALFQCLVPGLLQEKLEWMLRRLAKVYRRQLVPIPGTAQQWLQSVRWPLADFHHWVNQSLIKCFKDYQAVDWSAEPWPDHLLMNFKLVDANGAYSEMGRDLQVMQAGTAPIQDRLDQALRWPQAMDDIRDKSWSLAGEVSVSHGGTAFYGYTGLRVHGEKIALDVFDSSSEARSATHPALFKLIGWHLKAQMKDVRKTILQKRPLLLLCQQIYPGSACVDDIEMALLQICFLRQPVRGDQALKAVLDRHRGGMMDMLDQLITSLDAIIHAWHKANKRIKHPPPAKLKSYADVRDQLDRLIVRGFISATPWHWLTEFPRYIHAVNMRLDKVEDNPQRDTARQQEISALWAEFWHATQSLPAQQWPDSWWDFRFELEELRVSQFAQELKTRMPVSVKRLQGKWRELRQSPSPPPVGY